MPQLYIVYQKASGNEYWSAERGIDNKHLRRTLCLTVQPPFASAVVRRGEDGTDAGAQTQAAFRGGNVVVALLFAQCLMVRLDERRNKKRQDKEQLASETNPLRQKGNEKQIEDDCFSTKTKKETKERPVLER